MPKLTRRRAIALLAPSLDLVVAMFAGNYNAPDQWLLPTLLLRNIILANVVRA